VKNQTSSKIPPIGANKFHTWWLPRIEWRGEEWGGLERGFMANKLMDAFHSTSVLYIWQCY